MSKSQRDKGARRERQVVQAHQALGIRAERVPLSGAMKFRNTAHTDVDLHVWGDAYPPWVTEVKGRASGEGFTTIKRWLSDADALFLIEDREKPLVVLPWSRWVELLLSLGKRVTITPAVDAVVSEAAGDE